MRKNKDGIVYTSQMDALIRSIVRCYDRIGRYVSELNDLTMLAEVNRMNASLGWPKIKPASRRKSRRKSKGAK